jgi:SAM-dependent methyltransferase
VVDRHFADPELAVWYDAFCPWDERADLAFYLPMVMAAPSALDVGCGTGQLLRRARDDGHAGRLCGLDPAAGMLAVARARADIEWVHGDLASAPPAGRFDLIVMSGHAFQVLVTDDALRIALTAIRGALTDSGRFAFETRNPAARAWELWTAEHVTEVDDGAGIVVRMTNVADEPVDGTVSFASTYTSAKWPEPKLSRSTLRFLDPPGLAAFLTDAGLTIEQQFGDWDRTALRVDSPEIITVARRA